MIKLLIHGVAAIALVTSTMANAQTIIGTINTRDGTPRKNLALSISSLAFAFRIWRRFRFHRRRMGLLS